MASETNTQRSSSSAQVPVIGFRSRRGSLASLSSRGPLDKEALSQALDEIHTTASRQETLTSFSDFDGGSGARGSGPKELVTGGLSGLYTRLRQSVAGNSPESARPYSRHSQGRAETVSIASTSSSQPKPKPEKETRTPRQSTNGDLETSHPRSETSSFAEQDSSSPNVRRKREEKGTRVSHAVTERGRVSDPKDAKSTEPSAVDDALSALEGNPLSRHKSRPLSADSSLLRASGDPVQRDGSVKITTPDRSPLRDSLAVLSSDDESLDGHAVHDGETTEKRLSVHSRQSVSTPESKREGRNPEQDVTSRFQERLETSPSSAASLKRLDAKTGDLRRSIVHATESRAPTINSIRPSISTGGSEDASRTNTGLSTATLRQLDASPNFNAGFRKMAQKVPVANGKVHTVVPAHLKRRVVSKEFWMRDENARDCFYCGGAFSTFRRKHHCRTCGQIFDAKCTTLVSGRPFDLPGTLRLCKPCESVIYGSDDDDSTVFTDEDEGLRSSAIAEAKRSNGVASLSFDTSAQPQPDDATLATPSIGIPASRRNREAKRRSAVIEFDTLHALARPSSSRSLKSLSGRPRSSSHKRHLSRHQNTRSIRHFSDERGPFSQETAGGEQSLPAFHNDNIIDPDLAPFLSDEGSDDDQPSLMSVLHDGSHPASMTEGDRAGLSGLLASAVKKGRSRLGERSTGTPSVTYREPDGMHLSRHNSKLRKRNASIASANHPRPSPRRSRSQNILKSFEDDRLREVAEMPYPAADEQMPSAHGCRIKKSAAMRGSDAPKIELNRASLQHVRRLLAQLLQDNKVPSWRSWEKALLPILLQCTDDVDPDVQRGDDMDVRNYIKLKKIPGGRPGDTSYVSGVVFSKHVALKSMQRSFSKPRLVIVTFAIEYARHNQHFMSLEPVIAQEREYLRSLVGRIVALRPQVLLVQRNVSGLALQMLQDAAITVIYNVKESVLAAIARVTKTILIKSVDKLSIDPSHLGQCESLEVKTYIHSNTKKTYIYISGCQPSLGCTIVLRGAVTDTLRQVKRITEFMCYVVYNLKLETCLMRDEFVLIPSLDSPVPTSKHKTSEKPTVNGLVVQGPIARIEALDPKVENSAPSTEDQSHVDSAKDVTTSVDKLGDQLDDDKSKPAAATDAVEDDAMPSQYRDLVETSRTRILSSSPFVKYVEPYLLKQAQEQERRVERFKRMRDQYVCAEEGEDEKADEVEETAFEMVKQEMIQETQPKLQSKTMRHFLFDVHNVQYQRALHEYGAKKKQWESFFAGSNGNPFDPFTHQNIFVLQSLVSTITYAPCAGPEVIGLSFYSGYESSDLNFEEDCTLGQFVEDICMGANTSCKTCNRKMHDHHRQYVHGSGQLSVSVKRYPSKIRGLQSSILMWSTCKKCNQETTVIPMSDNTWKYSFGKYLELSFWSTPLKPRAGLCPHDMHKDFVRCFGFQDQCVRVQFDSIDIYEVLVPSSTINWAINSDLALKNTLYTDCVAKLTAFIESVKARLDSINVSTVSPDKTADATAALEKLVKRAEDDHGEILLKMQAKYMSSRFYEVIPLNRAVRMMDEKAISWDEAFVDFERNYFPSETDIRRLATLQLKKLFLDRNEAVGANMTDSGELEGLEMQEKIPIQGNRLTDEEMHSEHTQGMLSSVVEEHGDMEGPPAIVEHLSPSQRLQGLPTSDSSLVRVLSPTETEKAVESEGVKHLDLAVPSLAPEHSSGSEHTSPTEQSVSASRLDSDEASKDPESFVMDPKPLNSSIIERIEQIRSAAAAGNDGSSESKPDSKIPRLTDLHRRSVAIAAPSLNRAQSQPNHVRKRSDDMSLDFPSIETVSRGELPTAQDQPNGLSPVDISRSVEQRLANRLGGGQGGQAKAAKPPNSLIPRSIPSKGDNYNPTRVSALAKHFEQLSREFERERLRERRLRAARSRQNRANPLASSQPVVEVYRDASEAVGSRADELRIGVGQIDSEQAAHGSDQRDHADPSSDMSHEHHETTDHDTTDHYTDTDVGDSTLDHGTSDTEAEGDLTDNETGPADVPRLIPGHHEATSSGSSTAALLSPSSTVDLELSLPKHEKSSLMKMLTSFWSERSASGWSPLEYPLLPTEHVFDDSDIIVREDEPSSVIALALSSVDYTKKLKEFRSVSRRGHQHSASQTSAMQSEEARQQAAIEASLVSETGTHMKYSFAHNQVKAQCKIFYAESFDALRRKCGVSDRFVESLSRSIKWDSKGGKTKSLFLKTLDDRFVIKSLQEVELKAFTRFAPDYFAFMSHTLFHGVPSVIAKMFGLFQVMIKNPATGVEFSSYLLVMENLFYDRKPTRRFDLKGSMRNRKIESTGQADEVLLDENLVETIFEKPLFVREHARKLVKASVWNDTMWLCKQNVMDYSLMAGFDDERKELFIGIIDCIRTYTWDKKLESWIKDRGKNKPTITSPKDYRNRFRVSMMQYVLQSPNVYHEFSKQLPLPTSLKAIEEQTLRRRRTSDRERERDGEGEAHFMDEAAMREMGSVIV